MVEPTTTLSKSPYDTDLNRRDEVIVFLLKDTYSVYKDNYYLAGIESGACKIKDRFATNRHTNPSYDADSVRPSLQPFTNLL